VDVSACTEFRDVRSVSTVAARGDVNQLELDMRRSSNNRSLCLMVAAIPIVVVGSVFGLPLVAIAGLIAEAAGALAFWKTA
jgi:hypothetical protein